MRAIAHIIPATDFSGNNSAMRMLRVIGSVDIKGKGTQHALSAVDPFIFLDEVFIHGEMPTSFHKHPHAGLVAVTYLLEGTVRAWDNLHGATEDLNHAGGVYWIQSGRGIVHGEAPTEGMRKVRLLQLWYNPGLYKFPLPKARYQLFPPDALPCYEDDAVWVKVIIGSGFSFTSPVETPWPIQYWHVKIKWAAQVDLLLDDVHYHGFIYVLRGQGLFGKNQVAAGQEQ